MKYGDIIIAVCDIPDVAVKGKRGIFNYYEDGLAVCDFTCVPIADGRVKVDPDLISEEYKGQRIDYCPIHMKDFS